MVFESDVPARLDRLPWGRFHSVAVLALGITWVLDGLEVTLAGAVSGALKASPALHLTDAEVGASASAYLAGAVLGAFFFGWLTDRLGRKRLFFVTLGVYIAATAATAFAQDFFAFALFRFLTGAGIGGEYTAINSALQELIPVHYRGRTDLAINGSFWLGALAGALVRRAIPESPRWLLVHGRADEAAAVVASIERRVRSHSPAQAPACLRFTTREHAISFVDLGVTLFRHYPRRAVLGLVLMAAQAFFYNAIFFTYAMVLGRFFSVPPENVGFYLVPFALSNFFGPLLLGRLFDTWGRKPMIASTYALSGLLLAGTAVLFVHGSLTAATQTLAWTVVFFFASAAASSAYLTVSESFPLEIRALAIALFYALGTALGGIAAPWIFGSLVGTGEPAAIAWGYAAGAVLMLIAAAIELWLGVAAERRSLEDVARPLSCIDDNPAAASSVPLDPAVSDAVRQR
jgi:MFS family permease